MANNYQDKPKANDILATSQGDIEGDFLYLGNTLNKEHQIGPAGTPGPSDATVGEGRHKYISLKSLPGTPPMAPPGDGVSQMFYADAGGNIHMWTNTGTQDTVISFVKQTPTTLAASNGYSFLPGGMMIQWGSFVPNQNAATDFIFPTQFPTNCYQVTLTIQGNAKAFAQSGIAYVIVDKTKINYYYNTSAGANFISFIAIGN